MTKSVEERLKAYVKHEFSADLSILTENEKTAIQKLVKASKLLDTLFMRQVWSKNEETFKAIDKNNSGSITFDEWLNYAYEHIAKKVASLN